MEVFPVTIKQSNKLVGDWHRHHKEERGNKFALGCHIKGVVIGAVSCGRAKARMTDQSWILECTRMVTNGYPNGCSKLYSAAARTAREMGYWKIQTDILATESGVSLKAAGWTRDEDDDGNPVEHGGGDWNRPSRGGRRTDQPMGPKHRWFKILNPNAVVEIQWQLKEPSHAR